VGAVRALLLIRPERDATHAPSAGPEVPRRVLVRLPNWLGDVLMARPLLRHLRTSAVERIAIGPAGAIDLLRVEDPALELHARPQAAAEWASLSRRLRDRRADVAILLPISFSSAWHALRWGARRRIGYAADGRSPLLHEARRRPPRGDRHLSEEYLALAFPRDAACERSRVERPDETRLPVADAHREAARRCLAAAGVGAGPFAIVAPGAVFGPAKRWKPERFAAIAHALQHRGLRVLLCGDAHDRATTAEVAGQVPNSVDHAGRTSLGEAAGLAELAAVVLSNDSGFAHLAAAVGAPTVVLFGSTSSAWTAPLGPRVRVVQHAPPCAPCFQRTCRIGYGCLEAIATAEVQRAIEEIAA